MYIKAGVASMAGAWFMNWPGRPVGAAGTWFIWTEVQYVITPVRWAYDVINLCPAGRYLEG